MEPLVELYSGAVGMPRRTIQEQLYEGDPWLAHAVVDFVPRLASMTQNLITGILVHS
jgi:hypothetical protein